MKKILVTGCSGFIGMHLCRGLLKRGENVFGIDNVNDYYSLTLKKARLEILKEDDNFNFLKIDLCDLDSLGSVFTEYNPEIVVNLAAQAGVKYSLVNPHAYIESNIIGFMNILECSRINDVERLVYASSSSVYGGNKNLPFSEKDRADKPLSIYSVSKKTNELMAFSYSHLYGLPTTGLRFFTVYGPWGRPDMSYYIFCDRINKGLPITVYNNGDIQRDFTYIDDVIEGAISAVYNSYKYEVFNLGNNRSENIMDLIQIIEKELGKKADINFMDCQPGDVKATYADIEYSKKMLGYNPKTKISAGIPLFVDWFKSYVS